MGVPSNVIYTSGTGATPISADSCNTWVLGGQTYNTLKGFSGVSNMTAFLLGYTSPNDGGQGMFYWNTATGTDDGGVTTIVPNGSTSGCWSRVGNASSFYNQQTVNSTSNATYSAANVTNQVLVRSGGGALTDTFPSAAAIIGAMSGAQVGSIRDLLIINENSGTLTISPGSGVTFSGNLSTGNFSISTVTKQVFKIFYSGTGSITVYG